MQSAKKFVLVALVAVLGAMVAIVPAHADSDRRVSVTIPFDFVVGNSTLKAGDYRVEKLQSGVVDFGSASGRHHFALVAPGSSDNRKSDPYLVFTRYGHQVFLSKIALSVDDNYEVLPGNTEKSLNQASGEGALVVQPVR